MRSIPAAGVVLLASLALTGCGDATGLELTDLAGFWNATRLEYTDLSGDPPVVFEAVGEAGWIVAFDVDIDGSFSGTVTRPDPGTADPQTFSVSGTLSLDERGEALTVAFDDATSTLLPGPEEFQVDFSLAGPVLTFTYETSLDFPDELEQDRLGTARGPVAARLLARFER